MNSLVIASLRAGTGKTAFIVGLAETLQQKTGYMKPFGDRLLYSKKRLWDYDAALMTGIYNMSETPDEMSIGFDHSKLRFMYNRQSIEEKIVALAQNMSSKKELLIVEAAMSISCGASVHLDPLSVAGYLKAPVVFVVGGDDDTVLDDIVFLCNHVDLKDTNIKGILINKVHNPEEFKQTYLPEIKELGIDVLGIVPYHSQLCTFTLRLLADKLFAKVLTAKENLGRPVKDIFIGAMSGNVAMQKPFFKKEQKLIITGGDRTDMILAAIETKAAGVILTNNILPPSNIISKAEKSQTPLLVVSPDTYQIARQIDRMEPLLTKDDTDKIALLKQLISRHVDISVFG